MNNSILNLEVVRFYPRNELKFLKLGNRYPQVAVQLSPKSFALIQKIAPEKIIFRKLRNSILVNVSSTDTVIPTGNIEFEMEKYVDTRTRKELTNIVYPDYEEESEENYEDMTKKDINTMTDEELIMLMGNNQYTILELKYQNKVIQSILYNGKK